MGEFRSFSESEESARRLVTEFNHTAMAPQGKTWSAKKPDIIQMWRNMRPNLPITVEPIDHAQQAHHSTYGDDGIRITGSWQFVSAVMSHIKDLVNYENPQTKLRLVLRGINKTSTSRPGKKTFVFYFNLESRAAPNVAPTPVV